LMAGEQKREVADLAGRNDELRRHL
jgi:hypothetical protein